MLVTLTVRVELPPDKADHLTDRAAQWLKDQGATIIEATVEHGQPTFRVAGVDTTSKKPFIDKVEAENEDAAKTECESKTRVVALVERQ